MRPLGYDTKSSPAAADRFSTSGLYAAPGSSCCAISGGGQGRSLRLNALVTGAVLGTACNVDNASGLHIVNTGHEERP